MRSWIGRYTAVLLTAGGLSVAGCGGGSQARVPANETVPAGNANSPMSSAAPGYGAPAAPVGSADTMPRQHHSKLAGAAVGAVAGHYMGHHALMGAAAGALVQHERNKHGH